MPQIISIKAEYLILLSFLLTFIVITNAFYVKKQFYPSVVYLTKSSTSLAVIYAQAFVFVILFGKLVQRIFLGQLRAIETEHLYDRVWFSITETCLAFTVFRDDFSPHFVALFAVLFFLKCFHWLLEDRVDYMEQSPVLGPVFHVRVIGLLSVLTVFDYLFISIAYIHTVTKGASVQIVFGFEYAVLLVSVISTLIKYILHSIEIRVGEQWETKGVFMLYSDLILGLCRLLLYMTFIIVMMKIHTFPLFAIRPMFIAMRAFRKSCNDVLESRRAIRNLNTMYPDLTAEDLARVSDRTCIICRDEMQAQQSIKRLGCQHIFHKNCLRSWFQRQQTCPICRTPVLRPVPPRPGAAPAAAAATPPPPPQQQQQQPVQAANIQPAASSHPQVQIPVSSAQFPAAPSSVPPTSATSSSFTTTPIITPIPTQTVPSNLNNNGTEVFSQVPFHSLPIVLPPFAFLPPPFPSANFIDMPEESTRSIEAYEQYHIKTRIQCLRNARTLLDASMIQMQQYMNIVLTQSNMDNGARLLENLRADVEQVVPTSRNNNSKTTNDVLYPISENDTDVIRRRRLEHYDNRFTSSTANQENDNNNR